MHPDPGIALSHAHGQGVLAMPDVSRHACALRRRSVRILREPAAVTPRFRVLYAGHAT
eukprot:COSAG02_NODE_1998_length_10148_cov_30.517663_1_plen_58_part_00